MKALIRVVVADDSLTARELLVSLFQSDEKTFEVVGQAPDGRVAIDLAKKLRPDVITMDVRMPRLDGLEATRCIMIEAPTPIVVVSGTLQKDDVAASMRAIRAGALLALAKPPGPGAPDFEAERTRFLSTIRALAGVKVVGQRLSAFSRALPLPMRDRSMSPPPAPALRSSLGRVAVVALAASTGGPGALRSVLDALPYDFPAPVLLVQHLAPGFLPGFADWLDSTCRLRVKVATEGLRIERGHVYIAPEDRHLTLSPQLTVRASTDAPVEGFRPSASVMFDSVAEVYGRNAVAAILTGMGRDGVHGLRRLHALGGRIIAQDEQTCSVFGMPAAAIDEGLADFVLPITQVATKLVELAGQEMR